MEQTYNDIQAGKIVYQKLQIKGVTAHSWLVIAMKKNKGSYDLTLIDSNYAAPQKYRFYNSDNHFYTEEYGKFSPYIEKSAEEEKLSETIKNYCKK